MGDFAEGFACGMLFGDGGDGEAEWEPPEWWITVPEPAPYEAYFLILVTYPPNTITLRFGDTAHSWSDMGRLAIAWGDPNDTSDDFDCSGQIGNRWYEKQSHRYEQAGQYLIHVTTSENTCFFYEVSGDNFLIDKLGSAIVLNGQNLSGYMQNQFSNQSKLRYVKYNGNSFPRNGFKNCSNLRRLEIPPLPETIPDSAFYNCAMLRSGFDFSNVQNIDTQAFYGCGIRKAVMPVCQSIANEAFKYCNFLQEVEATECISAGNYAFENSGDLRKVILNENCSLGSGVFNGCISLERQN